MVSTLSILALAWIHNNTLASTSFRMESPDNPQYVTSVRVTLFPRLPYRWLVGGLQSGEWRTEYSQASRPKMKGETGSVAK